MFVKLFFFSISSFSRSIFDLSYWFLLLQLRLSSRIGRIIRLTVMECTTITTDSFWPIRFVLMSVWWSSFKILLYSFSLDWTSLVYCLTVPCNLFCNLVCFLFERRAKQIGKIRAEKIELFIFSNNECEIKGAWINSSDLQICLGWKFSVLKE